MNSTTRCTNDWLAAWRDYNSEVEILDVAIFKRFESHDLCEFSNIRTISQADMPSTGNFPKATKDVFHYRADKIQRNNNAAREDHTTNNCEPCYKRGTLLQARALQGERKREREIERER